MSTNNIKLEKLFKEKFGEQSLDLAIEQGFDKKELLKSLNINICKINTLGDKKIKC